LRQKKIEAPDTAGENGANARPQQVLQSREQTVQPTTSFDRPLDTDEENKHRKMLAEEARLQGGNPQKKPMLRRRCFSKKSLLSSFKTKRPQRRRAYNLHYQLHPPRWPTASLTWPEETALTLSPMAKTPSVSSKNRS